MTCTTPKATACVEDELDAWGHGLDLAVQALGSRVKDESAQRSEKRLLALYVWYRPGRTVDDARGIG